MVRSEGRILKAASADIAANARDVVAMVRSEGRILKERVVLNQCVSDGPSSDGSIRG